MRALARGFARAGQGPCLAPLTHTGYLTGVSGAVSGRDGPASPYDVVIVGGGVIGCAVAHFLLAEPGFRGTVAVVERDPSYARASSQLSASAIRQQFSQAVNILLGQHGIAFLRAADQHLAVDGDAPALALRELGYLYLATPDGRAGLAGNHALQRRHNADVALLQPDDLRQRFPWLSLDGVALGSLGLSGEGWFDGPALHHAFRRGARTRGAAFLHAEAVGMELDGGGRVSAVRLADGTRLGCGTVVNAAGPYARHVAAMAGLRLPVEARRRCVFVFRCPDALPGCPLVIDPSGLWFRPEGDGFLCGVPPAEDPEELDLTVDHALFGERAWPLLAARVPAFERLRLTGSWAGHYEYNTFDQNGLVGPHPELPNLIAACGFSGHGMQQSPGVGRGVAEWIAHGEWRTLDLSPLSPARVGESRPLLERCVI